MHSCVMSRASSKLTRPCCALEWDFLTAKSGSKRDFFVVVVIVVVLVGFVAIRQSAFSFLQSDRQKTMRN